MEQQFLVTANKGQLLQLPLVHHYRIRSHMVQKCLRRGEPFQHFAKLRRARPFGAG